MKSTRGYKIPVDAVVGCNYCGKQVFGCSVRITTPVETKYGIHVNVADYHFMCYNALRKANTNGN